MASIKELEATVSKMRQENVRLKIELETRDRRISRLEHKIEGLQRDREKQHLSAEAPPGAPVAAAAAPQPRRRRDAITAEPSSDRALRPLTAPPQRKPDRLQSFLRGAFLQNDFMKNLDLTQIDELINYMQIQEYKQDDMIITEGEKGNFAYVIEEGEVQVTKKGIVRRTMYEKEVFGELAILYGCLRTASVQARTRCKLWAIDRGTFQDVMRNAAQRRHSANLAFLKSVRTFKTLDEETQHRIADALEENHYEKGEYIIRQGAQGDTFYIIQTGTVSVTTDRPGGSEQQINRMFKGDFFGEIALEREEVRSANVIATSTDGVTCLCLDRDMYKRLKINILRPTSALSEPLQEVPTELKSLKLNDLTVIAPLGTGGFGRVELVFAGKDRSKTYALKRIKKQHIVKNKQQRHVLDERKIMQEIQHPFLIKLYRTFRDRRYVYMMMEVCMGGELYQWLKREKRFPNAIAQFYMACTIKAMEYLHGKGIVYRDLKPENLLLSGNGYVKMCDFGFAKKIGHGKKTYTFCGTPEYVAPEVILNRGYSLAIDLWALGVLCYELLNGKPPFNGNDAMDIYNSVQRGIQAAGFPRVIPRKAESLIRQLCRNNPTDRLGYGNGRFNDIIRHKWFEGFSWKSLEAQTLKAPIIPDVQDAHDTKYFGKVEADSDLPAVEMSGWDEVFDGF